MSLAQMNRSQLSGKCEPDPVDPDRVSCTNPVLLDDRQGISHFFGRNKRATATIPITCYPLQCRGHYQERKYRMKDTPGLEAGYQCDQIMVTLQRMSQLTWLDPQDNTTWPRWVGFELQMCKSGTTPDLDPPFTSPALRRVIDDEAALSSSKRSKSASPAKRKRNSPIPTPVPEWLAKLCSKTEAGQDFVSVGDRGGARYDIHQLARIVRAIKSWCLENNSHLPSVEALPITMGMICEVQVAEGKLKRDNAKREYNIALNDLNYATMRKSRHVMTRQRVVEGTEADLEAAEEALREAKADLEAKKMTLPVKRVHKPSPNRRSAKKSGKKSGQKSSPQKTPSKIKGTCKESALIVDNDTDVEMGDEEDEDDIHQMMG